ncbi:MAG: Ribosomal RNA small subunit methyltransferase B [candidate division WS6 bacterium GW2011_GWF2_39_15]|uniref:Ribosomal RNA small subunit methyltransferase B n=1 Tax=candidate division WS6 bacterium GW2011_GWF2_39_15 TaxID=1619100 RepID=A0A0G0MR70_9BACT|nr:MAG: Ribosomal RNA small subunit methyltransferase B [candidate division WS6 bacterium GW2011_GWF2_39_15]
MKRNKRSTYKQDLKNKQKYYTKLDIFLSRMASILKMPTGVVKGLFSERAITTIRLNNLLQKPDLTLNQLKTMGAEVEKVEWLDSTYTVNNMDKSDLAKTQLYKQGFFYIQNLSSMIPAAVLDPKSNEVVLDMCAAPGSKTSQMASMLNNKGEIVANDVDRFRAGKLIEILHMFNVKNVKVRSEGGEGIGKREEGHYDKILLDAPCSGEGLVYLRGEKPLRFWNIKKVKPMVATQKKLIESAFQALKKGGVLVYSTCTLEPEENEGVVTHLLAKYKNAEIEEAELFNREEFKQDEKNIKRGIRDWNNVQYFPDVSKTYRVIPSGKMMGFYIAKIVKK